MGHSSVAFFVEVVGLASQLTVSFACHGTVTKEMESLPLTWPMFGGCSIEPVVWKGTMLAHTRAHLSFVGDLQKM